ncbi:hypothetical protein [Pseudofrankia sp. BMG5.37]|uniref:hypothetical protein n=1 Tax=Pseudofrankia sp. BMG5.37 TaxID=3050035 RepID=UPI0028952CAE|nr:hypothetical protein [Pseudofrankia sp. BMG5.37]MDT3446840.1 hypothetical protein [Pseudofrankia sp. BMG5.37]
MTNLPDRAKPVAAYLAAPAPEQSTALAMLAQEPVRKRADAYRETHPGHTGNIVIVRGLMFVLLQQGRSQPTDPRVRAPRDAPGRL